MLTPEGKLLLLRVQNPSAGRTFWITPGGGIEESEDTAQQGLLFALRYHFSEAKHALDRSLEMKPNGATFELRDRVVHAAVQGAGKTSARYWGWVAGLGRWNLGSAGGR